MRRRERRRRRVRGRRGKEEEEKEKGVERRGGEGKKTLPLHFMSLLDPDLSVC